MNSDEMNAAPKGAAPKKAAPKDVAPKDAVRKDAVPQYDAPQDATASGKGQIDNRARLQEITAVLRKHHITRGVTPEKLRAILEELGPTYVKLGQIMSLHSDVLPQRYCD